MAKKEETKVHKIPVRPGAGAEPVRPGEGAPQGQRLSYEQLMQLAAQTNAENQRLRQTCSQMKMQLERFQMQDYYQRLEWLWKVITLDDNTHVFTPEFVQAKVEEFIDLMTPINPEEENKQPGQEQPQQGE